MSYVLRSYGFNNVTSTWETKNWEEMRYRRQSVQSWHSPPLYCVQSCQLSFQVEQYWQWQLCCLCPSGYQEIQIVQHSTGLLMCLRLSAWCPVAMRRKCELHPFFNILWNLDSDNSSSIVLYTRRYGPLRGPTCSPCGGLRPSVKAFFFPLCKIRAFYAVLAHYWLPTILWLGSGELINNFVVFHRIGPVVAMSVCTCVCVSVWYPFSCGTFWGLFCPHFPKSDVHNF